MTNVDVFATIDASTIIDTNYGDHNAQEAPMSRVQLALRVSDLEGSIHFYSSLFGVEPAKRRPGYANFAVTEPPLKLVLLTQRR